MIALRTFTSSAEAETSSTSFRVECGQTERTLPTDIAPLSVHHFLALALAVTIAGENGPIIARQCTPFVTRTPMARWVAVVAQSALITLPTSVSFLAATLSRFSVARLSNRADYVTGTVLAALLELIAPGVGNARATLWPVTVGRTDTAPGIGITDIRRTGTYVTTCK